MNDPAANIFEIILFAFVPFMLLFPLVFVLFVPTKVEETEARENASRKGMALTVFTFLALATWGAIALIAQQTRLPIFEHSARMAWVMFFPLWFGLAMPTVLAKNPAWGGACRPMQTPGSPVRTASLKPRHRENPIRTWHWVLMTVVSLVPLILLLSRGAFSFGPAGPAANAARFRWVLIAVVYGFCALVTLPIVPISIRKSLVEPEPLDPAGSLELEAMYSSERRKRILSLYWLLGVVQPLLLGALLNAIVWSPPASGRTLGIIGAVGGTTIGIAGGIIGTIASIRRMRIAEERARLESVSNLR